MKKPLRITSKLVLSISSVMFLTLACVRVQASDFVPAAAMSVQRSGHTATLLQNGKLLVVGGYSTIAGSTPVNTAEIYDPATNTWTPAGSLTTARAAHTATLLQSGLVLVAGGVDPTGKALSSAEFYDPVKNSWGSAGNFVTFPRTNHTATLLANGRVLIAGGNDGVNGSLTSAEYYDPFATSSPPWVFAGNLLTARDRHVATLLASGKVLVAGGNNSATGPLSSAEVYDPAAAIGTAWSAAGTLSAARFYASATTLRNGNVLVAGGFDGNNFYANADLYTPAANSWSAAANMTHARELHTATLLPGGQVLAAGGLDVSGAMPSGELYDPTADAWTDTGNLIAARYAHTTTLLSNGKALVTGGQSSSTSNLKSAELFDAVVTVFTTSDNPAFLGSPVTYTFIASDATVTTMTYTLNFGDGTAPATGSFTQGTTVNVLHSFNVGNDNYVVTLTVVDGPLQITRTLVQDVPPPSSGGLGVQNISTNDDPVTDPLDGLKINVTGSNGGVIQLGIDVSGLTRSNVYDVSTLWGDVQGRGSVVSGTRPVHQYIHHGIFVADVTATNRTTGKVAGHARKTLAISTKETGETAPIGGAELPLGARVQVAPPAPGIAARVFKGQFFFSGSSKDTVTFTGSFQLPAGLDTSKPQEIWIGIGNVISTTTLDVHGNGKLPGALPVLKRLKVSYLKVKRGAVTTGTESATVNVTFNASGMSASGFDTEGVTNSDPTVINTVRQIQVALVLNGVSYETQLPVNFSVLKNTNLGKFTGPVK